jgi:predicted RNA-binding protein
MTTHVFIVDLNTFKVHLEYLFAGTGAKEYEVDFNNSPNTLLGPKKEGILISMMADACRIRRGDYIIFYLQQNIREGIQEGKFFGIFQAIEDGSFLDNNNQEQYLRNILRKSLTFRTLLTPYQIYSVGVTEWEALDEIRHIQSPNQMLWSLIYRKLKANRGNTMVTIYESERLFQLIRNKNRGAVILPPYNRLSFNTERQEIINIEIPITPYIGRREDINIIPRLTTKYNRRQSFEPHLQCYIIQNIGRGINQSLDNLLLEGSEIEWIGNEVSCGVGMQRIDVMISCIQQNHKIVCPIELKATRADESNLKQIQRYIDWIRQYYIPNRPSDIQPILITKDSQLPEGSVTEFNATNRDDCRPLKHLTIKIQNNNIVFNRVNYRQNNDLREVS